MNKWKILLADVAKFEYNCLQNLGPWVAEGGVAGGGVAGDGMASKKY